MPHEDRIGQSAWDYGTVIIIMIATLAVSPGNARVYGEELLSAPEAGTGGTKLMGIMQKATSVAMLVFVVSSLEGASLALGLPTR
jgi:hypothetical protein